MTTWFTCKIQYIKQLENDKVKAVTETYLVDAVSFSDAEARIYKCISSFIPDFRLISAGKTNFMDVFNYEDSETWYKCKVSYVSVDEGSGKEKRISSSMLVAADNVFHAYTRIEEQLKTWITPYTITDINLTPLIDVFPYFSMEDETVTIKRKTADDSPRAARENELLDELVEVIEEEEEELNDDSEIEVVINKSDEIN